jgi:hypothetical protein
MKIKQLPLGWEIRWHGEEWSLVFFIQKYRFDGDYLITRFSFGPLTLAKVKTVKSKRSAAMPNKQL